MGSQLRRKPNAFNLLHQMNLLRKFNSLKEGEEARCLIQPQGFECQGCGHCAAQKRRQVWAKACEISEAYVVGKAESQAALHLYNDVSPKIAARLSKLVQHLIKTICPQRFALF